jgi:hypothetical protein
VPIVKWITSAGEIPGQSSVHRMARADFNIRGWQGRWRYTASTALFFVPAETSATTLVRARLRSSQAGDLRSAAFCLLNRIAAARGNPP